MGGRRGQSPHAAAAGRLLALQQAAPSACHNRQTHGLQEGPPSGAPALTRPLHAPCPAAFLLYAGVATLLVVYLIYWEAPRSGTTNIFVYLGICSTAGSLSVISCKVRWAAEHLNRLAG